MILYGLNYKHPCNDEIFFHQGKGVLLCDKIALSRRG